MRKSVRNGAVLRVYCTVRARWIREKTRNGLEENILNVSVFLKRETPAADREEDCPLSWPHTSFSVSPGGPSTFQPARRWLRREMKIQEQDRVIQEGSGPSDHFLSEADQEPIF
ncbi:unnamed protein product [Lota lota]